ncbi:MAG: hypothetical protein QOI55_2263 [Actinomycetota bacterium]|jgi:hypothetical protein|nr:hypothetical protein [Actinomycetota bacterium]
MLWFERKVLDALTRDVDDRYRARVIEYVDQALGSMPEYLRAGVAAESILLGAVPRARAALGRFDDDALRRWLAALEASPIDLVRQYVRLLSSLVLFANEELVPA